MRLPRFSMTAVVGLRQKPGQNSPNYVSVTVWDNFRCCVMPRHHGAFLIIFGHW